MQHRGEEKKVVAVDEGNVQVSPLRKRFFEFQRSIHAAEPASQNHHPWLLVRHFSPFRFALKPWEEMVATPLRSMYLRHWLVIDPQAVLRKEGMGKSLGIERRSRITGKAVGSLAPRHFATFCYQDRRNHPGPISRVCCYLVSCGVRLWQVGEFEFRKPQVRFLSYQSNPLNFKAEERYQRRLDRLPSTSLR